MLIPFYIFTYEKQFGEYNTNEEKLSELQAEYAKMVTYLDRLVEQEKLSSYEYNMVIDMSRKVLDGIAAKYENVRKGVREMFGGKIIETETLKNYRAVALDTKKEVAFRLRDVGMDNQNIAYVLRVSVGMVEEWLDPVPA